MKAVILSGGRGTRLEPYTTAFPKPLVPVGGRPILDIIVRQLIHHGISDIVMSVGYLAELIQAYFHNGSERFKGINLSYVKEDEPMGTAGPLQLIPDLESTFLVMNGDILTSLDYSRLIRYHQENKALLTIATYEKKVKIDLGVIEADAQNALTGYLEKPVHSYRVSMGIYVYEKKVLDYIAPGKYLDFPDLVLRLLENKEKVIAYPSKDLWLDIGRKEDYLDACKQFEEMKGSFLPE